MRIRCIHSGSDGNCYALISDENEILLLDCGVNEKNIKSRINFQISSVVGCVVTHSHLDHCLSAEKLKNMGIPVYKPYEEIPKFKLRNNSKFTVRAVDMTDLNGNWTHTNADGSECVCYGFLITHPEMGKLLYATDTCFIKYRFNKLNHILLGVNYDKNMIADMDERKEHVLKGHMELETAIRFIQANKNEDLLNVIACHLSGSYADSEHFINEIQKVAKCPTYIAYKGMEITLHNGDCPF